jgi:hypothetical protein
MYCEILCMSWEPRTFKEVSVKQGVGKAMKNPSLACWRPSRHTSEPQERTSFLSCGNPGIVVSPNKGGCSSNFWRVLQQQGLQLERRICQCLKEGEVSERNTASVEKQLPWTWSCDCGLLFPTQCRTWQISYHSPGFMVHPPVRRHTIPKWFRREFCWLSGGC